MTDTTPTPPEGPHADVIERTARAMFELGGVSGGDWTWADVIREEPTRADAWREDAREVLAAMGDVVPRDSIPHDVGCEAVHFVGSVAPPWTPCGCDERRVATAQRERDEALTIIEQVRAQTKRQDRLALTTVTAIETILDQAPADALARVKAEAGAQALEVAAAHYECRNQVTPTQYTRTWLRDRAAALREGAVQ